MLRDEPYDAVVIGAGMSGLAAGIRLAQFDQRVVVLERHSLWGGLNSFYKLAGHAFDVGLHALTNYTDPAAGPSERWRPLNRVLRQLRIDRDELALAPQRRSCVRFPGVRLDFSNGLAELTESVAERFPAEVAGFRRLCAALAGPYPDPAPGPANAREGLSPYVRDPLLVDMLLLPVCYYGSPTPHDLAWNSFVVLFKSLYEEGFARPRGGVRTILAALRRRYLEEGGELRMRSGVRRIRQAKGHVSAVVLDDGSEIRCRRVLSSAGRVETMRLAGLDAPDAEIGALSFVEAVTVLDTPPAALGEDATITFFNTEDRLVYERPEAEIDFRSGVLCCPDNYPGAPPPEPTHRVTLLANHRRWCALPDLDYYPLKEAVWARALEVAASFSADVRAHARFHDVFTPRTIEDYTGHLGGAVYGSPTKSPDGRTPLEGLVLCGTDQGCLGIVGALLSGITIANRHVLAETGHPA